MKKLIYISLFTVLGIVLQFLVHELVEIWYINLLIGDFPKYSLGFSWENWFLIHYVGTIVLLVAGALFGFFQGKFWWRKIYK